MKVGRAIVIFTNIKKETCSEMEKVQAIKRVLEMPTHNGITKSEMVEVIDWLLHQAYEIE